MFTLRCTQKLLKHMGAAPRSKTAPPTTTLGNWYANLIPTCRGGVVVCTNETTLLTVALPLTEGQHPLAMFTMRVYNLFMLLGVPVEQAEDELSRMSEVEIAKSQDRRMLGTMNEIAYILQELAEEAPAEPLNVSVGELEISENIFSYTKYIRPAKLVRVLLSGEVQREH